ncbi:3-deoxy-7-phosphoheptulonate synthase [Kutzneria chonburiensis]|uniref:3-deoxy-7-phosphoheptulonate synthase n=1 Tax=Kutzneria chonburiensis TaxID=1483604 RepID=A0ABV6MJY5_9PSEU|nr:3-deoxy-7-phosphoheptulonate synthase [Kutzneria chonburiensis]
MTTVILLQEHTTRDQLSDVVDRLSDVDKSPNVHSDTLVSTSASAAAARDAVGALPQVVHVQGLTADYPKAALGARHGMSKVRLGSSVIGGNGFTVIAGPCSVETPDQMMRTSMAVRASGAHALRGGVFKPRTSPYAFQGLGRDGLSLALEAREATGLPFVTEIMDLRDLPLLAESVDMLQVGARNMQNYSLLREIGSTRVPVLLKRGLAATIDETLMAAEYLLDGGNEQVVLCERGIRTFESSYRFTLDVAALTVLRERTHLPVIVDPSHAAGASGRVIPLALAAAACGADGIIVESHCDPSVAKCDGAQALPVEQLPDLMRRLRFAVASADRRLVLNSPAPQRQAAVLYGQEVTQKAS